MKTILLAFFCFWGFHFAFSQEDCRVKDEDLQPVIQRFNPFFTEHKWLPILQQEMARIDKERYLVISHHGCKRHFTVFNLFLRNMPVVPPTDSFWVQEARNLMRSVYYDTPEYALFGKEFEENFEERLIEIGLNYEFNFPLGKKNFLCEITYPHEKTGAKIRIEVVDFIFLEEVVEKKRGQSPKDDGFYEKKELVPIIPAKLATEGKSKKKGK